MRVLFFVLCAILWHHLKIVFAIYKHNYVTKGCLFTLINSAINLFLLWYLLSIVGTLRARRTKEQKFAKRAIT